MNNISMSLNNRLDDKLWTKLARELSSTLSNGKYYELWDNIEKQLLGQLRSRLSIPMNNQLFSELYE